MEIDFELYRVFCIVAECGNFSKAAEKLYISQPAVTQSIKKLEDLLKGNLFYRTNKGVALTDEGKRFYNYLKTSVDIMNNAENKFSQYINLEEGEIKIKTGSALGNVGIYDAIIEFSKKYPKVKISVSGGYVMDSIEELSRGAVDLVAVNLPFKCDKSNIQIIECKDIEDCFYVSKVYFEENVKGKKDLLELIKTDLVAPSQKSTTGKILNDILKGKDIDYTPKFIITSTNARKYFVSKGLGIGFGIKDSIKDELDTGAFIELKVFEKPLLRSFGVVTQSNDMISNATLKLVEFMKEI